MNKIKIPASVAVLTFNSGTTLRRALESVKEFDDIILCDGGSTDDTRSIALEYGARILDQDPSFKDESGRILDFGGVRNQTLDAARHPWFLFLDSDELLSDEVVDELRDVVSEASPAAFWVPRLYMIGERTIDCASTYPNRQMRFFHTSVTRRFIKEVHERIELADAAPVRQLVSSLLVPFPEQASELRDKWRRYLAIEERRQDPMTFRAWVRRAFHDALVGGLYLARMIRNLLFCRGNRMPFPLELARLWYQKELIRVSWRAVTRF